MQDRYTMWRIDAGTKIFFVVLPAIAIGGAITSRNDPAGLFLAPGLILLAAMAYLNGPSARVTISPTEVIIVNPFELFIVPVSRIQGWDQITGWQQPRLRVDGLPTPVPVRAFQLNRSLMSTHTYKLWVRERMRCIDRVIAEQLPVRRSADVVHRRRWSTILVIAVMPLLYVAALLIVSK